MPDIEVLAVMILTAAVALTVGHVWGFFSGWNKCWNQIQDAGLLTYLPEEEDA